MSNEVKKGNPYRDALGRFASGGAGGGVPAGGASPSGAVNAEGKPLSTREDRKLNDLSIDMWNHKQGTPASIRTGNVRTPQAQAHIRVGQQIVSQAQEIFGGSREETMGELNRRMGA